MIASADISISSVVVSPELIEIRITQSPRQADPAAKHTPSCCTFAITASVADFARRGIAGAEIDDQLVDRDVVDHPHARLGRQPRGHLLGEAAVAVDHSAIPLFPKVLISAQTGTPRARRLSSGT